MNKPSRIQSVIRAVTNPRARIQVMPAAQPVRPNRSHPALVKPGQHDHIELAICYAGESNIVGDSAIYRLRPGDALLIMPGAWHYESYVSPRLAYNLCWMRQTRQWIGYNLSTYARRRFRVHDGASVSLPDQFEALAKLSREARDQPPHWQVLTRSVLAEILVELDRNLRDSPVFGQVREVDPVWKLLRIVETRFREPLQLKHLAREVGLSEDYLGRRFHAAQGTTFKHYLLTIRIHHAQLLLRTGLSVKQTAEECGFNDE